jgi:type I restriction enzyme R subunit
MPKLKYSTLSKGEGLIPDFRFSKFVKENRKPQTLVEKIMSRMIFDGEKLTDLLAPLDLSWKERRVKELALMQDLVPQLKKLAQGRDISGLAAYE